MIAIQEHRNDPRFCTASPPKQCFLCFEDLGNIYVLWQGHHEVGLHPHCANSLGWSLLRDVWEVNGNPDIANNLFQRLVAMDFEDIEQCLRLADKQREALAQRSDESAQKE